MGEYRKTYQQKFMQVRKNKDNKNLLKTLKFGRKKLKKKLMI